MSQVTHRKTAARICQSLAIGVAVLGFSACEAFKVDVGTAEPIKLDPIKFEPIDIKMRVDVYQYTGESKEDKQAAKNVEQAVEAQRNRMKEIQTLKNSRWVGENHLGMLSILHKPAGKDGAWVQNTVDAENADRLLLMTHKSNETGMSLAAIRRQQWQARTQSSFKGEMIQVAGEVRDTYRWEPKPAKEND